MALRKCTLPGCTYSTTSRDALVAHIRGHQPPTRSNAHGTSEYLCASAALRPAPSAQRPLTPPNPPTPLTPSPLAHPQSPAPLPTPTGAASPVLAIPQGAGGNLACHYMMCNVIFATKQAQNKHARKQHNGLLSCSNRDCTYTTMHRQSLVKHERFHTGEKPFACGVAGCGFTAAANADLSRHTRSHTGEKPYACDVEGCGYACSLRSSLVKHNRVHTGEKPYACDVEGCGYACSVASSLVKHNRIHTGEKPYACDVEGCGHTATTKGAMNKHMASKKHQK
jgi:uncharacterized Zn-finger protein